MAYKKDAVYNFTDLLENGKWYVQMMYLLLLSTPVWHGSTDDLAGLLIIFNDNMTDFLKA